MNQSGPEEKAKLHAPPADAARGIRWRIVLGRAAEQTLGELDDPIWRRREQTLSFLYDCEYDQSRNIRGRDRGGQNRNGPGGEGSGANQGGGGASGQSRGAGQSSGAGQSGGAGQGAGAQQGMGRGAAAGQSIGRGSRAGTTGDSILNVPDWLNSVHELFPKATIERIEKDALERYHLEELMTNPDLLRRAQPSENLLKAVLRTKHLMNKAVLAIAKDLVRKVVEQLMEKLARKIRAPFLGSRNRQQRSFLRVANNFDARKTIRKNLSHYDYDKKRLFIETPIFFSRVRKQIDRWQIIILVDQSGSMVESVIYSAVTASIFHGLKSIKTHLCAFDTNVIDLSDSLDDPVDTLMKVQLGGGTDIGRAMHHAASLIENPRKSIVILITDFFEGTTPNILLSVTKQLLESGTTVLGLAALDQDANPSYNKELAQKMVDLGAQCGAMTPGELAAWVAEKVR